MPLTSQQFDTMAIQTLVLDEGMLNDPIILTLRGLPDHAPPRSYDYLAALQERIPHGGPPPDDVLTLDKDFLTDRDLREMEVVRRWTGQDDDDALKSVMSLLRFFRNYLGWDRPEYADVVMRFSR